VSDSGNFAPKGRKAMKTSCLTIVVVLFAITIGGSPAAAQALPEMIAYDGAALNDESKNRFSRRGA
jgi:hypothetical protein